MDNPKTFCQLCKKNYKHLGSHLWHAHKVRARDYKEEYELPFKMGLISEEVREKKQAAITPEIIDNLIESSKHRRFKKGHSGIRRISEYEQRRILKNLDKMNDRKPEKCPVCNRVYKHMPSHLANKHKLISIKK